MKYQFRVTARFKRQFRKLDCYTQRMISNWIDKNLVETPDPRSHGKPLRGNHAGQWRYRIGNYRLICEIEDNCFYIQALAIGHRKEIYR